MTMFWNHAKGRGENNYTKVDPEETLTWDEFNVQDIKWVARNYPKDAVIPEHVIKG